MNIRKRPVRRLNFGVEEFEDCPSKTKDEFKEPATWTIITALDRILDMAQDSQLSDEFWESVKNPLAFLNKELGLTNVQIVALAMLVEAGEPMSWKGMGNYLDCSRLSIMVYSEEIEELVTKRWAIHKGVHEIGGISEGMVLVRDVITALRHNKPFVPEKIDGLNEQQFVDKLERHIEKNMNDHNAVFDDDEEWMLQIAKANPHLPLCHEVLRFDNIHVQSLLLLIVVDYAQWEGSDGEGLTFQTIDRLYPDEYECEFMRERLRDGSHPLIQCGYIEYKCVEGQADAEQYMLTRKAKVELLSAYKPSHSKCRSRRPDDRCLKSHKAIKEKSLFFNISEQEQIDRLTCLLSTETLPSIQKRLEEQSMRKGFACLFYGAPGTGKTETVLQIARQTGRDLMQVDIAGLRDKWVGESEKNIKEVFARYRRLCKNSEVMPILFFNEADAIINKRTENVEHSVDKMDNAMQNIILQEIEDLDGILIATTNLTSNLDKAFERRFLYKVEFHKPDTDVKTKIWCSMLKDISVDDARRLALRFDFSGGQIENIARKRTVDYILSGKFASLDEIEEYCHAELLSGKERRSIGFIS
ncbi:ATP-binding protein [Prevotella sp. P6B1]|uniref:ATP-binding protein n=1 Tax=Prevotella sp. P6B1 TaxID=1410613 RepID=UPI0009DDA066|nr:ATP-binding protein [Prevotella sp. P6B1]